MGRWVMENLGDAVAERRVVHRHRGRVGEEQHLAVAGASAHDGAHLHEHGPVEPGFQTGQFGAERLWRHVLTMLRCLADGIRQHVSVSAVDGGLGQLTGDGQ